MRKIFAPVLAVAALSAAFLGFAAPANAGILDSCGVEIRAGANCEIRTSGGCTTSCTPINFTAQCSAELYVGCNGMCSLKADVNCTTSCEASCATKCQVDPPKFECAASCRADCDASCGATCTGTRNTDECRSGCKATCGGKCDAKCDATPPSADCSAKCSASCSGSCEADVNMGCQVDCQSKGFIDCETKLEGGCKTACSQPDGALFCDGQYVDVGDQLDKCVADLKALLNVEVKFYADGNAECSGNTCTAEGEAGFSCAQSGAGASESSSAVGMLGAIAAFGLALSRRKKNQA